MENTEEEQNKPKYKKILDICLTVLMVIILLFSATTLIFSLCKDKNTGLPKIFGYYVFAVQTDSMEPTIKAGDLIFGKDSVITVKTDKGKSQFYKDDYQVGDIVTFWDQDSVTGQRITKTHRIVDVKETIGGRFYYTAGDNTDNKWDDNWRVASDIISYYSCQEEGVKGTRLKGVGNFVTFLSTSVGFFVCIVLPMLAFFIYEVIGFVRNLLSYQKEQQEEKQLENVELTEELKRKAIEEYLAGLEKEKENTGKKDNESGESDTQ